MKNLLWILKLLERNYLSIMIVGLYFVKQKVILRIWKRILHNFIFAKNVMSPHL
jgi:hypothetical protein